MRAEVAEMALRAGAVVVNDVSGGLADPAMPALIAASRVPYVVMHWRGHSVDMQSRAVYSDVFAEVCGELTTRVASLIAAGVDPGQLVLDPGLGFAKQPEHNWALLARLSQLGRLPGPDGRPGPVSEAAGPDGFPVLVAASRKRFIGRLLAGPDGEPRPFAESDDATIALTALAAASGAWCVRVHQVPGNADAVRVAARLAQAAR
jgi:dihydropteroate synthase